MVHDDLKQNSTDMLFEYHPDFSPLSDSSTPCLCTTGWRATMSSVQALLSIEVQDFLTKLGEDDFVILQCLDNTACLMAATRDNYKETGDLERLPAQLAGRLGLTERLERGGPGRLL